MHFTIFSQEKIEKRRLDTCDGFQFLVSVRRKRKMCGKWVCAQSPSCDLKSHNLQEKSRRDRKRPSRLTFDTKEN